MAAYLVANVHVTDREGFAEYGKAVPATVAKYGGTYLVRGGESAVLEGAWEPKRLVVLQFPDRAQLLAWYESEEYKPLRALRERTARTELVLVEGV